MSLRGIGLALAIAFAVLVSADGAVAQPSDVQASARTPAFFGQLANEVSHTMLGSPNFGDLVRNGRRPRLIVGNVTNRTDDETIMAGDMLRAISEVVIADGRVDWLEPGANEFDLIASPILTSGFEPVGNRRACTYTLTLTLSDVTGTVKGRWSATQAYRC